MSTPTHNAVATVGIKAPLGIIRAPTITPAASEVRVRVEFVASTPLDLHQNDGGVSVIHPQVLGDSLAGTVVEVGADVATLKVGDKVFGFSWNESKEKAQQEYITTEWWHFGKVPETASLEEAVTLPNNFVTAWHTFVTDLDIALPWPKPDGYAPASKDETILIWGAASSVGQYALQVLKYYGYTNVIATASPKHWSRLKEFGAATLFDYRDPDIVQNISHAREKNRLKILDCIGSCQGSIHPISKVARNGDRVAILLPVIVRDSSDTEMPEYASDVNAVADWEDGVETRGVRTHFYANNEFHRRNLQPEIMPALLAEGVIKPNAYRLVEGKTLLERAQNSIDTLRRKEVSGERLVWRVAE